ncbi:hypothetical protein EUGRSUZ_L01460 [Eucalyptus grandis]|uniref:TIR domain-containing protein n=4 Tax=Eucalyptus grandis TaxID=71139 RepID=A0AAD9WIR4_EUCGR|nr:hypothetical protein EUGRSUZ_L01460 [Eucalyptus grandis]
MGGDAAWGSSYYYDVYLSFKKLDTYHQITDILYQSLVDAGIRVFRDDAGLGAGDELARRILKAIDSAKIYIPIFSKRYAYSKRCLRELASMVDTKVKSGGGKTIIPIFYDVEPRDVRLETPLYRDALSELRNKYTPEDVKAWEGALREVGFLRGWDTRSGRYNLQIVDPQFNRSGYCFEVRKNYEAKEPVGIDKQVDDMMDLLDLEVSDVRIVGIWGRSGVGKTTLARCSFLADIGATAKQLGGVRLLQSKLMSDILNQEYEVDQVAKGVNFLKGIFRNMKVLLVLDDEEVQSHLHEIVGEKLDWFGYGSRIIVTTSIKSVLPKFISQGLAHVYGIDIMNNDQAFELFRKHAPRRNGPIPDFDLIAKGIIKSVNGMPLLIEVIGSLLSRKVVEEWTALKELNLPFGLDIEKILMLIYEELSKEQREIFLDIACLPVDADCRIASFMWHNPIFPLSDGVDALRVMSLVKVRKNNELGMHRLLREFGQQIIRKEDHLGPGRRGRLCNLELGWNTEKMEWLQWQGCTGDFEATNFHVKKLAILDLSWSKVTEDWGGWREIKLPQLKVLNLTGCADLLISPDLSSFPDLEILILERCSQLVKLDPSIRHLKCLTSLNLRFCDELNMLPIELGHVKALKELLSDGTSVQEIPVSLKGAIPTAIKSLDHLRILRLGHSSISDIPLEIGSLSCLQTLDLLRCNEIQALPGLPSSLTCLCVSSEKMKALPNLNDLVKLEEMCLGDKDPKELICPSTRLEPKSRSRYLSVLPIVLPKLKMLELSHSGIGELKLGLGSLSCTHLKKLVLSGVNLEILHELPSSLSVLSIRCCLSLRQLPAVHHLRKLSELNLIQSAVEEIKGLQGLTALEILNITHCEIRNLNGLGQLGDLRRLILSDCDSLGGLPDISNLKMLNVLVVQRCRKIADVKGLMELTSLEVLHVSECEAESTQQVQDALKFMKERSINS